MSARRKRRKGRASRTIRWTLTRDDGTKQHIELKHIDSTVKPPMSPNPQNMVSTARWVVPAHLNNMSNMAVMLGGKFNPRIFPTCTVKMRRPRVTISIFRTGSIVIAGARNSIEAIMALTLLQHRVFIKSGRLPVVHDQCLENVVASAYLGFRVDLDCLMVNEPLSCKYNPELFAGLCYRVEVDRKIILVIFESGSVVITGCRTRDEATQVFWTHVTLFQGYMAE